MLVSKRRSLYSVLKLQTDLNLVPPISDFLESPHLRDPAIFEITCENCNANQNSPCTGYVELKAREKIRHYAWDSRFDVAKDGSGILFKDQGRNSASLLFILCGIFGKISRWFRL